MAAKPKQKKLSSLRAAQVASIPTTIKNPERVAHRRTELIEVATKMFLERGFHNTSIRDIVRACPFNIASLYMYVSSKEDILYLVAQELMNNIARELTETILVPSSAERSLEIGFASYCRIVYRFRRSVRLLYREVGFLPPETRSHVLDTVSDVVSFFEKIVIQGIEAGVFRDVPSRLAAMNVMFGAHMLALHTRHVRSVVDLENYIKFQLGWILAALLAEPKKNLSVAKTRVRATTQSSERSPSMSSRKPTVLARDRT